MNDQIERQSIIFVGDLFLFPFPFECLIMHAYVYGINNYVPLLLLSEAILTLIDEASFILTESWSSSELGCFISSKNFLAQKLLAVGYSFIKLCACVICTLFFQLSSTTNGKTEMQIIAHSWILRSMTLNRGFKSPLCQWHVQFWARMSTWHGSAWHLFNPFKIFFWYFLLIVSCQHSTWTGSSPSVWGKKDIFMTSRN